MGCRFDCVGLIHGSKEKTCSHPSLSPTAIWKKLAVACRSMMRKTMPMYEEALTVFYEEACGLMPPLRSLCSPRELKKSVANNRQLLLLAKEYMEVVIVALRLLAATKLSLSGARDSEAILLQAIECFENRDYARTLDNLEEFRGDGSPFAALLSAEMEFSSLCERQLSIAKRLATETRGRLSSMKILKKVSKAMWNLAFISVLVLSVVLAAVSAPAAASVAAAAGGSAIKSAEQWLDSVFDGRLDAAKVERDAVLVMVKGVSGIHDLYSIRDMVKRLGTRIGSIWGDAAFAVNHGEITVDDVVTAMGEIKGKVVAIQEWIGGLKTKMDDWDEDVRKGVAEFLNVMSADS